MLNSVFSGSLALRARHRLSRLKHDPTPIIAVVLVAALTYLVLSPVLALLADGFRVHFRDVARARAEMGAPTVYYLQRVFSS